MTTSKLTLRPGDRRVVPLRALWPGMVLVLAGCAGVAPPRPGTPAKPAARTSPMPPATATATPAASAPPAAAAPAAAPPAVRTAGAELLAVEQRWLQDWFRGTPVDITLRGDGTLAVEVPREFCFDDGRSQVKPALAAVLDKVAESLRRRPGTRLTRLAAPADTATAPATLGLQRAVAVNRHLRERGITAARLGEPVADGHGAVQLRIVVAAP